jgi:hypothetical protein
VPYVLRVRTNVVIIITSALGYFYFAGLRSFAIIFVTGHYGISQSVASVLTLVVGLGALAGVYLGGRTTDRLLGRGYLNTRVLIPAVALLTITVFLAPGIVTTSAFSGAATAHHRRRPARRGQPADGCGPSRHHPSRAMGPRRRHSHAAANTGRGCGTGAVRSDVRNHLRRWRPWTAVHLPGLSHHTDRRPGCSP